MSEASVVEAAPGRGSPVRAGVLAAAFVALAPMAVYASAWTQILVVVLALAVPASWSVVAGFARSFFARPAGIVLLALAAWAVLSAALAVDPGRSLLAAAKVGLFVVAGLVVVGGARAADSAGRRRIQNGVLAGAALIAILLVVSIFGHGALASIVKGRPLSGLNFTTHAVTIFALLAAPVAAILVARARRAWPALAVAVGTLVLFSWLPMRAASLAVVAGIVAGGLAWRWPRRMPWAAAWIAVALAVSAPWLSATQFTPSRIAAHGFDLGWSYKHRFVIWEFTSRLGMQRPVFGHGFDASDRLGRDPEFVEGYRALVVAEGVSELWPHPPLHPHNAAIQVWYEFGAVGLAMVAALLLALAHLIVRHGHSRLQIAMATAFGAIVFCVGVLSYGLWQKWWLASVWLAIAACAAVAPDLGEREPP